jgi:hypothetical protein
MVVVDDAAGCILPVRKLSPPLIAFSVDLTVL